MAWLSLGPLVEARSVYDDLAVGREFDMGTIHRARCRALEIYAFTVIAATVTRTLEFVFAGFPVWRAAEMCATGVDDENAIRRAVNPDTVFLLPLGVDAQRVIGGIANFEDGGRLEKRARQEKSEEGDKPGAQESRDGTPHQ